MKLFRFNGGRIGVTSKDVSYDLTDALGIDINMWPPVQMVALIAEFDKRMAGILDHPKTKKINISDVRLEVPIEWPNKLLAYPANYRLHQLEMKSTNQANVNGFFMKANTSLSGPNDPIVLPDMPGREIHHDPGMIELASKVATLLPGDIIASGTPEGVGPMKPGDRVRIAIEHLGEMDLDVKAA